MLSSSGLNNDTRDHLFWLSHASQHLLHRICFCNDLAKYCSLHVLPVLYVASNCFFYIACEGMVQDLLLVCFTRSRDIKHHNPMVVVSCSKELVSCRLALESETVNTSLTSYNARWWSLHCPVAAADTADSQSENNTKAAFMCLEHGQGPEAILVSAKVAAGLFARLR